MRLKLVFLFVFCLILISLSFVSAACDANSVGRPGAAGTYLYISYVGFSGINKASGFGSADYTSTDYATVERGETYTLTVNILTMSTAWFLPVAVYIDWDGDGDLSDETRIAMGQYRGSSSVQVIVPDNANTAVPLLMRVIAGHWDGLYCNYDGSGCTIVQDVEDYSVCVSCTPNCTGKECGDDSCGGSCGTCATGSCQDGLCINCAGKPVPDNCVVSGDDLICDLGDNLAQDAFVENFGTSHSINLETASPSIKYFSFIYQNRNTNTPDGSYAEARAVIKINKTALQYTTPDKVIFSTFFNISFLKSGLDTGKSYYQDEFGHGNKTVLGLYKLNTDWSENTVTWDTLASAFDANQITNVTIDWHNATVATPKFTSENADGWTCYGYPAEATYGSGQYVNYTITDLYNSWNSGNNYGFYIKDIYGDSLDITNAGCTTGESGNIFGSSESNMKPKLILEGACKAPTYPEDLLACWKFEDNLQDFVGVHDGWYYHDGGAATETYSTGKVGKAVQLDGAGGRGDNGNHIRIKNSDSYSNQDFNFSDKNFTLEMWVSSEIPDERGILGRGECHWVGTTSSSCSESSFYIGKRINQPVYPPRAGLTVSFYNSTGWWHQIVNYTPIDSPINTWHHIVYQRNGNVLELYLDGKKLENNFINKGSGTELGTGESWDGYLNNFIMGNSHYNMTIGTTSYTLQGGGGGNFGANWKGKIDEVAIWERALTPEEIQQHWNNSNGMDYCTAPEIPTTEPELTGAYWSNMRDVKISSADLKDTVKLNIAGSGLSGNANYTIYKETCTNPLSCVWGFFFGDKVVATLNSSYGYATWQAGKKNDGSFETGDYYFKARLAEIEYNSYDTPVYGVLTVNSPEKNAYPAAVIVKPDPNSKHAVNMNINFTQASYDEDDELIARWNFADGNITSLYNCQTSNCDTTHSYSWGGTKVIELTAEEVLRGQKDTDYRRIYIYKPGINVFAVISDPDPTTGERIYEGIVSFNASLSYVAICNVSVCPDIPDYGKKVTPAEDPTGKGCYKIVNSTAVFYCYDLDNSKIGAGTYNLWFNWTFDEGPGLYGNWSGSYSHVVGFNRGFVLPRQHEARLLVGYESLS